MGRMGQGHKDDFGSDVDMNERLLIFGTGSTACPPALRKARRQLLEWIPAKLILQMIKERLP